MKYTFKTPLLHKKSNLMWNHRLEVPLEIASKLLIKNKRVVCEIENLISIQCALMSDGKGGYYIVLNKENRKKINAYEGKEITVVLSKDESKYGMPMPKEFEEIMAQDIEVDTLFHSLTPGLQRSVLHILGKPKGEDIRLKKALIFSEYLKSVNGKLDFKELNIAFKNGN